MPDNSRRAFLKTASVGLAAAGVATAAPVASAATPAAASAPDAAPTGPAHRGPVLARVEDVRSGTISVLAGEQEIVHHDPVLARQLARLAAQAARA